MLDRLQKHLINNSTLYPFLTGFPMHITRRGNCDSFPTTRYTVVIRSRCNAKRVNRAIGEWRWWW